MMKKTIVAMAAVAAVSAYAQTTVILSGRASMDVSTWGATGSATASNDFASRTRIADTSSRITFSVNEDLGGGMNAGVYCETGFSIDTATANGQANVANSASSEWCSREGRLYIGNDTVELRLGRQNVWWTQGGFNDSGSNKIGTDVSSNFFNGGMGLMVTSRGPNMIKLTAGKAAGAFANSEVYAGLETAYERTDNNVNIGVASLAANGSSATAGGSYQGLKLNWDNGGNVIAAIDYQTSTSSSSTTAISTASTSAVNSFDRTATRYSVGYKYMPDSIVSLQYWNKSRTDRTNGALALALPSLVAPANSSNQGSGTDSGYVLNLNHALSPTVMAIAQYARANNMTNTSNVEVTDSGATGYSLGGIYRLSKRTHVYGAIHQIQNGVNANYGFSGGAYQSGTNAGGSTVSITALGLQHNF